MLVLSYDGPNGPQKVQVDVESICIGRHADNEVFLPDPRVARRHCLIIRTEQGYTVLDNHSPGGIFVNGKRVNEHLLRAGDRISVGASVIVVEESDDEG